MEKKYNIENGKIVETDAELALIHLFISPDEKEKRYLVDNLKIDEHTLNSSLDPDELSRFEFEPEHFALIFKRPKSYTASDQYLFKVASTGVFLFKDRVIFVMADDAAIFEGVQFTKARSATYVVLKIIYHAIFHFLAHLKIINDIQNELQRKINTAMENKSLISMFEIEKSLIYYLNSINYNGTLFERLKNNAVKIGMNLEEMELLDDILVENNQCYKQAEMYLNIYSGLMDARASIVSNNLNVLMKTLNVITIAIMVPTLVVSAFSMNVTIPLSQRPFAFFIILGLAFTSVMGFMALWRYKKW